MGFRNLWVFNQALLSKLGWWILSGKDCLCIKVLRAKYKIRVNWLAHHSPSNASPFWKSMSSIKHLIAKAVCLFVGNEDSIRTWFDPWIPDPPSFTPTPKVDANSDIALVVSQLLTPNRSSWDISKLRLLFEEQVVDLIQKIPIPNYHMEDSWSWTATNSGLFSVKSAYWLCREGLPPSNFDYIRGPIWRSKIHERLKMHLWRIAANVLPTMGVISKFNENVDRCCSLCNLALESSLYLFTVCHFAKSLWFRSHWGVRIDPLAFVLTTDFANFLLSPPFLVNQCLGQKEDFLLYGAILCDMVWRQRNQAIFGGNTLSIDKVSTKISCLFSEHKIFDASSTRQQVPSSP